VISTNDILSSKAAAPAAGAAASKQAATKNEGASDTTFATMLAETTNADGQATQPATNAASNAAINAATTQVAVKAAGLDTSTTGETATSDITDATIAADPAAILTGIITPAQTAATGALGMPATGLVAEADGAETPVDGATVDGADIIAPGLPQGATPAASATATATAATPIAATAPATTPATDPALQAETAETPAIDGETASAHAPADGDKPSKASASTTNTSAASATATATQANAAAQVQADIPVDAAATQQKAAAVETATAAATTTSTHEAARAPATITSAQAAAPATTVQVYTRMIERFDGRAQRFEVRLDPAELGRVDVRIEVGADKKVHAVLAAHDSAALTDLMRGQRALERALTDAGFDLADGGVKFQLASDSNHNAQTGKGDARSPSSPNVWRSFNSIDLPAEAASSQAATPWRHTRLDLVA